MLNIKGNSGCDIEIVEENGKLYVIKSSSADYGKRLLKQGEKQISAFNSSLNNICVPKVYENTMNEIGAKIKMDYVRAYNFIDFFEHSSAHDINLCVDNIISFIEEEIQQCEISSVDSSVLLNKLNEIEANTKKNKYFSSNGILNFEIQKIINAAKSIFSEKEKLDMPIGICHGDLTFSNILFNNSKCYLIDFLDSFIETPLQDIVKIRQDTRYKWSEQMYTEKYDKIRVDMIFDHIDKIVDNHFSIYEWYKNYKTLQIMNILRIVPYAKTKEVAEFLTKTLNELCNI